MSKVLRDLVEQRNSGNQGGIYSVCSSHPLVIEAALLQALDDDQPLLIEATCNQVNQFGGYTGMTPLDFKNYVRDIAKRVGFPWEMVILGGDHLGPNPWRHLPAGQAMDYALRLVKAYAEAGFSKLHLDASMRCVDDPDVLNDSIISVRAAALCKAAETAVPNSNFVYVIGTEVPIPGGATESLSAIKVTTRAAALNTLAVHKQAFEALGLQSAWQRVIALVVQPGVEFDHNCVVDYDRNAATELVNALSELQPLVYEAHSTDHQTQQGLAELVQDGFAILKVGPALTFALREGLQSLANIENALVPSNQRSNLMSVLDQAMLDQPDNWQGHYHGDAETQAQLRVYSLSDRSRYYMGNSKVQTAVHTMLGNLSEKTIPLGMISQHLPVQFLRIRNKQLKPSPKAMVIDKIRQVLRTYSQACNTDYEFPS